MRKLWLVLLVISMTGVGLWVQFRGKPRAEESGWDAHEVVSGTFERRSLFTGTLESVRRESVFSRISQPTAILYLAPEGTLVEPGDMVAVFDASTLRASLVGLERDVSLAEAEKRTLVEAEIPLQLAGLEAESRALRATLEEERRIMLRMEELEGDGLVSGRELETHRARVARLKEDLAALERKTALTREVVHPGRIQQAEAKLESARSQRDLTLQQVRDAEIRAGIAGMVVYLPLHFGGEHRTAREGDTVHRNQEFMHIADMERLVARCLVPENRLSDTRPGSPARVVPEAFPELDLEAQVLSVGSVATTVAGRPSWQKFFTVNLLLFESDPRLRNGMTTRVHIQSRLEPDSLLVPRSHVSWEQDRPHALRLRDGRAERMPLELDGGNDTHFRVVSGLQEGDQILRPRSP